MVHHELHHGCHVLFIARCHHHKVREDAHVRIVVGPVVRRAVGGSQAASVEAEDYMQVLQGHFLEDLIERPLEERRVDGDDGFHACLGHTCCEGYAVRFADAYIEKAGRVILTHLLQLVPLAHGCSDDSNLRIGLHHLMNAARDRIGICPGTA